MAKIDFNEVVRNINSGGASQAPSTGGGSQRGGAPSGGYVGGFAENYRRIKDITEGRYTDPDETNRPAERSGMKRGNIADQFFAGMGRVGEEIQSWGKMEDDPDSVVDDVVNFGTGLVTGTLSAPFTGTAQIYEGLSGRRATEMDESGYIPEEDLDLGQRLATTASGAINVVGPRFGGTGEMLKTGKRAGQMAVGAIGASQGQAWGARMMSNAAKGAREAGERSLMWQIGQDALEEGVEEFVQSPLDEIREGTFDEGWLGRAANAGAYGALGGGIMSGGAAAVNYGLSKINPPTDKSGANESKPTNVQPSNVDPRRHGFNDNNRGTMVADARDAANQSLRDRQTSPGSASALQVYTGKRHALNNGDVGAGLFKKIFYYPDRGRSAQMVADWFGTDVQTMAAIMQSDDYAVKLNEMHQANKAAGKARALKLGRNPATEKVGRYDIDVDEIIDADYIDLNPLAYNFVKSDVDGDKITIFLDPSVVTEGYITRRLQNSVANDWDPEKQRYERRSNLDFGDYGFLPKNLDRGDIETIFKRVFDSVIGAGKVDFKPYVDRFSKSKSWDDADYARFFSQIMRDIDRAKKAEGDSKLETNGTSDQLVSELISEIASDPVSAIQRAHEYAEDHINSGISDVCELLDISRTELTDNPNARSRIDRGAVPAAVQRLVQLWTEMNNVMAKMSEGNTNVMFRQDGALVMRGQAERMHDLSRQLMTLSEIIDANSKTTVFDQLLAITIKQSEMGGEIMNNVSGMFDAIVRNRVRVAMLAKVGRISKGSDFKDMLRIFMDEWNKLVPAYEKASKNATTRGLQDSRTITPKPKLEGDPVSIGVVRAFVEAFDTTNISSMIDTTNAPALDNVSWGDFLDAYVQGGRTDRTQFGGYDSEFQEVVDLAIASRMARVIGVEKGVVDMLGDVTTMMRDLFKDGLKPENRAAAEYLVTSLRKLFDPEIANRIGLVSVDNVHTGDWGRALTSGNRDAAANAVLSMALSGKYDEAMRLLVRARQEIAKGNEDVAERFRLRAVNEIGRIMGMSQLDRLISSEIYNNVKTLSDLKNAKTFSSLFDGLTDMDISFDEKNRSFMENDAANGIRLMTDALNTDSSSVGASGISNKMKKARSELAAAARADYSRNLTMWQGIRNELTATKQERSAATAIVELLLDSYYDNSTDVVAGAIYATTTLANAMKEKGLTPKASQMIYQMAEMNINGAVQSFSDKVFGRGTGIMSISDFRSNPKLLMAIIADPNMKITVFDPERQADCVMDRKAIIDEATDGKASGYELTMSNLDAIFTKWPNLLSYIPDAVLSPGVSEEGQSSVTARNQGTILKSITDRMSESNRISTTDERVYKEGNRRAHLRNKRIVQAQLLADTDFVSAIIYRIGNLDGRMTLSGIQNATQRICDDFIEGVLNMATSGESETMFKQAMYDVHERQYFSMASTLMDMYSRSDMLMRMLDEANGDSAALWAMIREDASRLALDELVENSIKSVLKDKDKASKSVDEYRDGDSSNISVSTDNIDSAIDRYYKDARDIMALMTVAFPQYAYPDIDMPSEFSKKALADVQARIDKTNMSDSEKKAVMSSLMDPGAYRKYRMDQLDLDISETVVQDGDFGNIRVIRRRTKNGDVVSFIAGGKSRQRFDVLKAKLLKINEDLNFKNYTEKEIHERLYDICVGLASTSSARRKEAQAAKTELMNFYNSLVVKHFIEQKMLDTNVDANPYLVTSFIDDFTAVDRMVNKARNALKANGIATSYPSVSGASRMYDPMIPMADYSDPIKNVMASRARVNTTRGGAAITVGVNGAGTRNREGLGFIPRDYHTDIPPREMTYRELMNEVARDNCIDGKPIDEATRDGVWNRFIEARMIVSGEFAPASSIDGELPYKTRPVTWKDIENLRDNPGTTILVFDPADSPNGIDVEHSYASYSGKIGDSLRVLQESGILGDVSQEGMALKSSKTVGDVTEVATETKEEKTITEFKAIAPSSFKTGIELKRALKKTMNEFRSNYRIYLTRLFARKENKVLGMGPMQAYDFARLLTPYFEVRCENGTTTIDAALVFAPDPDPKSKAPSAFDARMAEIQETYGRPVSISPKTVTPELLSARIGSKISDDVASERSVMSSREASDIARKAVESWSDYRAGGLSVGDVMNGVMGRPQEFTPYMMGDDQQSVYNEFIDDVYGGNTGHTVPSNGYEKPAGIHIDNDVHFKNSAEFMRTVMPRSSSDAQTVSDGSYKQPNFTIVKSFGADKVDADDTMYRIASHARVIENTPPNVNNGNYSTVGIVLDESDLFRAITWGCGYRQRLLIPERMFMENESKILAMCPSMPDPYVLGKSKGGKGERFYLVEPYASKELNYAARAVSRSYSVEIDPAEIYINMFDFISVMADASGNTNIETTGNFGIDQSPSRSMNMRSMFGTRSVTNVGICDADDIAEIRDSINAGNTIESAFVFDGLGITDVSKESIVKEIESFLSEMARTGSWHRNEVSRYQVIAIVKAKGPSGTVYAPLIADGNAPVTTTSVSVVNDQDGNIEWRGDAKAVMLYGEAMKAAMGLESYKSITVPTDAKNMPLLAFTQDGSEIRADAKFNWQTFKGRIADMDAQRMLRNLWYGYLKFGGSLFYENVDGKWRRRAIFDKLSDSEFNALVEGDESMWSRVRRGEPIFSDDNELNWIISRIATKCFIHGVPYNYLFSSITGESVGTSVTKLRGMDVNFNAVMSNLDRKQMLKLFSHLNPALCPSVDSDGNVVEKPGKTMFDQFGNMYIVVKAEKNDGEVVNTVIPMPCSIGPALSLGHSTMQERVSGTANNSLQRSQRGGLETPLHGKDARNIITDLVITSGSADAYGIVESENTARSDRRMLKDLEEGFTPLDYVNTEEMVRNSVLPGYSPWTTYKELLHQRSVEETADSFRRDIPIIGYDGSAIINPDPDSHAVRDNDPHSIEMRELRNCMNRVSQALGAPIDWQHFVWALMYDGGTTLNGGVGSFKMSIQDVKAGTERIVRSIKDKGLVVSVDENTMVTIDDRYAIPLLTPDLAEYFMMFPAIKAKHGDLTEFRKAMVAEAHIARGYIENIVANGTTGKRSHKASLKRDALFNFLDWTFRENGLPEISGHVYADQYVSDIIADYNSFWARVFDTPDLADERKKMQTESERTARHLADLNRLRLAKTNTYGSGDQATTVAQANDAKFLNNVFDYATRISQMLAVMSPGVAGSNILDKGIHTNLTYAALAVGRNLNIGPYGTDIDIDQAAVKQFAENPLVQKTFAAYRMAMIDGDVASLVTSVENEAQLDAWIARKRQQGSRFVKVSDAVFNAVNGGNIFMNRQLRNFANYFFILEKDAGHNIWFQKNDQGQSIAESVLSGHNSQRFLIDVLTGRNNNYSFANAQVAMNFAMQGDMAQRNLVSMLYQEMIRRHGNAVKFFTSTFISRFFQYRTNQMGRTLQWVLPMSSINYAITKWVAENTEIGRAIHVEDAQVFTDIKRALANDAAHMAPNVLACILAFIPGLIVPPDDEDKRGNPQEWLFCGHRVYTDWELEDIMGLSLPMAAFFKSVQMGQPRIDILFNGLSQACYNNPMARVSDIVTLFGDGDGSLMTSFENDVEDYADAYGGSPSFTEWLTGKFHAASLSYVGQFITPAFIREFIDSPIEHSYNRIYAENEAGQLTEEGAAGATMRTSYRDAQIRKITRNNPVLAWIADFALNPNTSYTEEGMPHVVIYDPVAMESANRYSINDEDGNPLPIDVQESRIAEVISILQSTDDMEALYQSGFFIDYDTRYAVGQTIWDICTDLTNDYYQLKADGGLNWEVLGEGDTYGLGQQRAQEITNAYYDELRFWESLYYDKLMSEPMRRDMPVYNRYKTSYAVDDNGEFYATGYHTDTGLLGSLLPIQVAPGSIDDPEGTMGYEGDWETPSVMTGTTTGERALIPADMTYMDTIPFESMSATGDGTGYSSRYGNAEEPLDDGEEDDSESGTPSWRYGYGGGRGGGGGGGGYSPNLYSRLPNVYPPSARTMYSERVYDANYDYLRPNFETKGSREAYKRSDI